MEELSLMIPLNQTGSAGLGLSLKARVSLKKDGTRHDCGIFVKKVSHWTCHLEVISTGEEVIEKRNWVSKVIAVCLTIV